MLTYVTRIACSLRSMDPLFLNHRSLSAPGRAAGSTRPPRPKPRRCARTVAGSRPSGLARFRKEPRAGAVFCLAASIGLAGCVFDEGLEPHGARRRREGQTSLPARVHVKDITSVLEASITRPHAGAIFNVADDSRRARRGDASYAADLIRVEPPPEVELARSRIYADGADFCRKPPGHRRRRRRVRSSASGSHPHLSQRTRFAVVAGSRS